MIMQLNHLNLILMLMSLAAGTMQANELDKRVVARIDGFVDAHCMDCHDADTEKGDLNLEAIDLENEALVHEMFAMVRGANMPPPKKRQPDPAEKAQFLRDLAEVAGEPHAVAPYQRRLTKLEYFYALEDLLGISIDSWTRGLLPDDVTNGEFDVSEPLGLSETHLRSYLAIADTVIDRALKKATIKTYVSARFHYDKHAKRPVINNKAVPEVRIAAQPRTANGAPFPYFRQGFVCEESGWYTLSYGVRPVKKPATVLAFAGYYQVDGALVIKAPRILDATRIVKKQTLTRRVWLNKGDELGFSTVQGTPVMFANPVTITGSDDSESTVFKLQRAGSLRDLEKGLVALAGRAYRSEVSAADLATELGLVRASYAANGDSVAALRVGLRAILCSPRFLFKKSGGSDLAFAEAMALFMWRSIPDAELRAAAKNNTLLGADLERQFDRMLESPKAERWLVDFSRQWLQLKELDKLIPDYRLYPEYDSYLAKSMKEEAVSTLRAMLKENRPVTEIIDGDNLYLNDRLARHYGLPPVSNASLVSVQRPTGSERGGFLTQGGVMAATADGAATSPVKRGIWLLERILGRYVPPPPKNVPDIPAGLTGAETVLTQLAVHRDNKSCRSCHAIIDAHGVAFEVFDPIGGLRTHYRRQAKKAKGPITHRKNYKTGPPVESAYSMPAGEKIGDVRELKAYLLKDRVGLTASMLEKLATFAAGRELSFRELTEVDEMAANAVRTERLGLRDLVVQLMKSEWMRR